MNFVLTCIHIYFVCYAFGSEKRNISVTRIQSKIPKSACGIRTGGPIVQQLTKAIFALPLGMFWVEPELVFVEYYGPQCCHYRPYEGGVTVSGIITELANKNLHSMIPMLHANRSYLLTTNKSLHRADFNGENLDITWTVTDVMDAFVNTAWNITNCQASESNKLWTSVNDGNHGELVMIDIPNNKSVIDNTYKEIDVLAWNKDSSCLYTIASMENCVYEYKFDPATDTATEKKVVFRMQTFETQIQGQLSCITVDDNGCLWLGVAGPGMVIQYNIKTKEIAQMISIPGSDVTYMAFTGHKYEHLMVSTPKKDPNSPDQESGPGALYAISAMGAKGFKAHWIDIKKKKQ